MKEELFNKYALEVCKVFDISEEDMFKKSKLSQFVDARYMLYYLCFNRKIKMTNIQKYMKRRGYDIPHSTIHYGKEKFTEELSKDPDYQVVVDNINALCTL